ncbi:hypothetical protein Tery_1401 [Trichodesmium erythraeum IMS101]|uniref:Uncharacterized protein n=1 Tax=Trichodesmium erythraeum (strain IMS101) TaxID=203124 RepID=Q115X4_TRIEI|nr:hypothetical protein [Trichodesmium erythraeum GBRTRLIN201]
MSKGVIYIATGEKSINEALISASSLKDKIPDLPITLFSIEEVNYQVFKKVILINNLQYGWIDKIEYIPQTPSEETLLIYRY